MAVLAKEEQLVLVIKHIVGEVWALIDRVTDVLVHLILHKRGPLALYALLGDLGAALLAGVSATHGLEEQEGAVLKIGQVVATVLVNIGI